MHVHMCLPACPADQLPLFAKDETHKLDSAEQAAGFLEKNYTKPSKDILKKISL